MSRCFPYPPPGYILSKASNDALIDSIKLQKEREKAKAEKKKERKREKKEKKEKKKEKENKDKNKGKDEQPQKKDIVDISPEVYGVFQKVGKDEIGLLERSGVTEEHGLPGNSQDPSNSSDSTQNSNKRKRHDSPTNGPQTGGGKILRIRLPSQKQQVCYKTRNDVGELQGTSGRIDSCNKIDNAGVSRAQLKNLTNVSMPMNSTTVELVPVDLSKEITQPASQLNTLPVEPNKETSRSATWLDKLSPVAMPTKSAAVQFLPVEPKKETRQSAPRLNKLLPVAMPTNSTPIQLLPVEPSKEPRQSASVHSDGNNPSEKHVSKKSKKLYKAAKKYAKVIDCIPLNHADEIMDIDEDWLCRKKNLPEPDAKVQSHNSQMSSANSCLLQPCAQYLQEADIYALPYSIPF